MDSLTEVWSAVCEACRRHISEVGFNAWIKIIDPIELRSGEVVLGVSSDFKRNIIEENYSTLLSDCFEEVLGFKVQITLVVRDEEGAIVPAGGPSESVSPLPTADYPYTFATFIVGSSNRFAHAASMAVAENPAVVYNPLFIYGPSGVGKTHLLLAIHHQIAEKYPEKKLLYVRAEDFTNDLIQSLHQGTINAFHDKFRTADVLMMDDIQFIAGKESTQEEFFNTFNALYQAGKQMVVTSDRPPRDIKTLDDRIRSRFESGLLADVAPPDFETRVGIIRRKAQFLGFDLNEDIIFYIAEQIKSNTRQLEGVVKKIQAYLHIQGATEPTITIAQSAIRDIRNDNQPEPVTVDKVISEVARTYGLDDEDIRSKKRDAPISYGRQVAMYIVREVTGMSYTSIGKEFGRDHSTVVYAMQEIERKLKTNSHEREIVEDIIKNLQDQ